MRRIVDKISLTIQKKIDLAKKVGLLPIQDSAWKSAIRSVVDSRGDLLSGRMLADAKQRLGKLSNNTVQHLNGLARKQRLSVEVGATIKTKGKIEKSVPGIIGAVNTPDVTSKTIGTVHTHPYTPVDLREGGMLDDMLKQRKVPIHEAKSVIPSNTPGYYRPMSAQTKHKLQQLKSKEDTLWNSTRSNKIKRFITDVLDNFGIDTPGNRKLKNLYQEENRLSAPHTLTTSILRRGDVGAFIKDNTSAKKSLTHSIVSPGYEGTHKISPKFPGHVKSLYWKTNV